MKAVRTFFKSRYSAIKDQLRTWGMVPMRAAPAEPTPGIRVRVDAPGRDGSLRRVGTLWQDGREFCFRYDAAFVSSPDAEAIAAFPKVDDTTYRSAELWPFFAVRLPPLRRADVREVLQKRGITEDRVLEVLGAVAQKSPTNPYELRLEGAISPERARQGRNGSNPPSEPAHSAA